MPKVSVILPNYNHAAYLPERLESVLGQDFRDFEVIILDDHSSDNSLTVFQKYASDKRITHLLENDTNSGSTFIQWEKGLRLAQGKYIWIAESDDIASPTFLSEALSVLENDKNTGVVFTSSVWIDEKSLEIHRPDHETGNRRWSGAQLLQDEFLQGPLIYNASSAVFRKNLTEKVDFGALRTFRYTGDWLFWVQVAAGTQVVRLDKRLNFFRRHDGNVSFKSEREGLLFTEGFRIIRYIYDHYPVSFLTRRETALRWARKLPKGAVPPGLPAEVRFYHRLFQIFK
ncbi:MAG: DUF3158 family protein [Leadbetterella sp.]|nr:DUF3158 family protein [Leadbetterella sp.]